MTARSCKHCGCTEFYSSGNCKACTAAYNRKKRQQRGAELNAKVAAWRAVNQDKIKAYTARYGAEHREEKRAYRSSHRDQRREQLRLWRTNNPQRVREQRVASSQRQRQLSAAWRKANLHRTRVHKQNRRAREAIGNGRLSPGLVPRLLGLQRGRCACCGASLKGGFHLDHILPLALGGRNEDANMQLLTPACNLQKSMKHPVRFMQERGLLL